jgi:HEAT repeats/HEAT repeat
VILMTAAIALSALFGLAAGIPLLAWARRWDLRILDKIEHYGLRALFPPLLAGVIWLLFILYPLDHVLQMVGMAFILSVCARAMADPLHRWRAAAHTLAAIVVVGLLASEVVLVNATTGGSLCRFPSLCVRVGGPRAVPALFAAFRFGFDDDTIGAAAEQAVVQLGKSSVPALIAACQSSDPTVRFHAASALGQIGDRSAVPALIPCLRDSRQQLRIRAVWALGNLGDRRAVPALMAALRDNRPPVREAAAWALGQLRDARAVSALAAALRDSDAGVRRGAEAALERIEVFN